MYAIRSYYAARRRTTGSSGGLKDSCVFLGFVESDRSASSLDGDFAVVDEFEYVTTGLACRFRNENAGDASYNFV